MLDLRLSKNYLKIQFISETPKSMQLSSFNESPIRALVSRGQLFLEKCELSLARSTFLEVIELAKASDDRESLIEAIAVLLRLSAEAKDEAAISLWDAELEKNLPGASGKTLALAWHNRAVVATHQEKYRLAQTYLYRARRAFEAGPDLDQLAGDDLRLYGKIQVSMAATLMDRKLHARRNVRAD